MKTFARTIIFLLILIQTAFAQVNSSEIRAIGKIITKGASWVGIGAAALGGTAILAKNIESGEAVYSVEFDLNRDKIYWTRLIGWPNIFPVLQVEGEGQFLIPEIFYNYQGTVIIWTFKIPKIPANRNVSIHILDDHSASNDIWNNILNKRWVVNLNADAKVSTMTAGMNCNASASGAIQLIDKPITIIGPKPICNYTVTCPDPWFSNEWHTEGQLMNGSGEVIGTMRFSQLINKK